MGRLEAGTLKMSNLSIRIPHRPVPRCLLDPTDLKPYAMTLQNATRN
jgi:hypothetical protein